MIEHTMIVSFDEPLPDGELDRFFSDMEQLMRAGGVTGSFRVEPNIRVPADAHAPVFAATAVARMRVADQAELEASFAIPGLEEFIGSWQARFPYKVVWVNHAPFDG